MNSIESTRDISKQRVLISSLADNLEPSVQQPNVVKLLLLWLFASACYVVGVIHILDEVRFISEQNGLAQQNLSVVEVLLGVISILSLTWVAFLSVIPGRLKDWHLVCALFCASAWAGLYFFKTLLIPIMPLVFACYLAEKMYPLNLKQSGLIFGLAAGMMPALYMQFACMHAADHALVFHLFPGTLVGLIAMLLMVLWGRVKITPSYLKLFKSRI